MLDGTFPQVFTRLLIPQAEHKSVLLETQLVPNRGADHLATHLLLSLVVILHHNQG